MSCDSSFFSVVPRVFAQQKSAAIGNQISPILASISVAFLEQCWFEINQEALQDQPLHFFCIRYVDHRIVLIQKGLQNHPAFRTFLKDEFQCNWKQWTPLEYNTNSWVSTFNYSLRPSFQSRLVKIKKYVWPQDRRGLQISQVTLFFIKGPMVITIDQDVFSHSQMR